MNLFKRLFGAKKPKKNCLHVYKYNDKQEFSCIAIDDNDIVIISINSPIKVNTKIDKFTLKRNYIFTHNTNNQ